jgi:hypothetical protein
LGAPGRIRLACLFSVAGDSKLADRFGNGTRLGFRQPRHEKCPVLVSTAEQLHIGIGTFGALHSHPETCQHPLVDDRYHEAV